MNFSALSAGQCVHHDVLAGTGCQVKGVPRVQGVPRVSSEGVPRCRVCLRVPSRGAQGAQSGCAGCPVGVHTRVPTHNGEMHVLYGYAKIYRLSRGVPYFLVLNGTLWDKIEKCTV